MAEPEPRGTATIMATRVTIIVWTNRAEIESAPPWEPTVCPELTELDGGEEGPSLPDKGEHDGDRDQDR